MVIKIYTTELSPPVRAVIMACDVFDVTFENIEVNLMDKEKLKPEFLTKNPLHTIPVLEDDDFILHDSGSKHDGCAIDSEFNQIKQGVIYDILSRRLDFGFDSAITTYNTCHAILMYLADAYGKDEAWYPKDEKMRALVNQKLFFDSTILYPRLKNVTYALVIEKKKTLNQKSLDSIEDGYSLMEQFLSRTEFIATDNITIADLSVYSNISSLAQIVPVEEKKYPKTFQWCDTMEKQPYCIKHNNPEAATLGDLLKQCRQSTSK